MTERERAERVEQAARALLEHLHYCCDGPDCECNGTCETGEALRAALALPADGGASK